MVGMVDGAALKAHNSRESFKIGSCGCCGYFCSKSMPANSCHRELIVIHKSNNVIAHLIHLIAVMMVRTPLISVVQQPDIPLPSHLRLRISKELLKVLRLLDQIWKPDECRHVSFRRRQEFTSELNLTGSLLVGCF